LGVTVGDLKGGKSEIRRDLEVAICDFKLGEIVIVKVELGSQIATIETGRSQPRKHRPCAFTFDALRGLMAPPVRRRRISFRPEGLS
jgi:hypothetical protein